MPANVMQEAEKLIVRGKTISDAARILGLSDPTVLYDHIREKSQLIRERTTNYEIDVDLLKYKLLDTLVTMLDSESENTRLRAAQALLTGFVPKRDVTEGTTIINFGMMAPQMAAEPVYIYPDEQGAVGDE